MKLKTWTITYCEESYAAIYKDVPSAVKTIVLSGEGVMLGTITAVEDDLNTRGYHVIESCPTEEVKKV